VQAGTPASKLFADSLVASIGRESKANTIEVSRAETDFSTQISGLKRGGTEVVVLSLDPIQAAGFTKQLSDEGFKGAIVGTEALSRPEFLAAAGSSAQNVITYASHYPSFKRVPADLMRRFGPGGAGPRGEGLLVYAAIQAWHEAVALARSKEPDKTVDALRKGSFQTAIGKVRLLRDGRFTPRPMSLLQWDAGSLKSCTMCGGIIDDCPGGTCPCDPTGCSASCCGN
jgi:branched-chain amino acid transport system substrate-binding protein